MSRLSCCYLSQNVTFSKCQDHFLLPFITKCKISQTVKVIFSFIQKNHIFKLILPSFIQKKTSLLPNRHGHPTVTNYCHLLENLKVIPALFITKCQSPHSDLLEKCHFYKLSGSSYCDEWAAAYRLSTV